MVHNDSSLIAFTVGKRLQFGDSFRIAAAHTDFPGLRVKPCPEIVKDGYRQLNVEVYGGAILNTWLDRPLSAAGRVVLRKDDIFHPEVRLVDFRKPFLTIPNLAIHINRDVNKGVELNKQMAQKLAGRLITIQLYDGTRTHLVEWTDGMDSYWFAVRDEEETERNEVQIT